MNTEAETTETEEIEYAEKVLALAKHLEVDPSEITETSSEDRFEYGSQEYWVMTDSEADAAWDESLENYIDECMEIPKQMIHYFDREAWKRDARMDGRGHCLNGYDGTEYDETVNDETYYIYRTN